MATNWIVRTNQNRTSLTHYGVKGMKWGVRKEYIPHPRKRKFGASNQPSKAKQKWSNLSTARKVALGVSATAMGVGLGYMAYQKIGQDYVGGVLKAGTTLHTIMTSENLDYGQKFYASFKKSDVDLYRKALPFQKSIKKEYDPNDPGILGNKIPIKMDVLPTYDVQSVVSKNIKYPSNKQAEKIYRQLRKESSEFALYTSDDYNAFNTMLVGGDFPPNKMFYSKLKELGYSALIDVNDQKGLGFQSNRPIIVFDSSDITKGAVEKLSELDGKTAKEVEKIGIDALNKAAMKKLMPKAITTVGTYGVAISVSPNNKTTTKSKKNKEESK